MKAPSLFQHLFSLIMPFSITVLIPLLIDPLIPGGNLFLKISGVVIGLIGLAGFVYTVFLFQSKGRGTLAPWSPTQQLVIEGPYRYSRNPMITSVFMMLVAEMLFFQSIPIAVEAALFLIINTVYFIFSEEPGLEERFGEPYRKYKKEVPRWLPRW